jgi:hypothetical protein
MTIISTQFTQKTASELNDALSNKKTSADAKKILEAVQKLQATIRPLHPGINDPTLSSYFVVEVPNSTDTQKAISALNRLPGITAAYAKPNEELA